MTKTRDAKMKVGGNVFADLFLVQLDLVQAGRGIEGNKEDCSGPRRTRSLRATAL